MAPEVFAMLEFTFVAVGGAFLGLWRRIPVLVVASLFCAGLTMAEGLARGLEGWSFVTVAFNLVGLQSGYLIGSFLYFSNFRVRPTARSDGDGARSAQSAVH
jgi:hypothetical protein